MILLQRLKTIEHKAPKEIKEKWMHLSTHFFN